jgi:hypothetical protein
VRICENLWLAKYPHSRGGGDQSKAAGLAGFDSLPAMKDSAKIESVIVGIFDDSQDLERADKRLAAAGFEGAVYDEAMHLSPTLQIAICRTRSLTHTRRRFLTRAGSSWSEPSPSAPNTFWESCEIAMLRAWINMMPRHSSEASCAFCPDERCVDVQSAQWNFSPRVSIPRIIFKRLSLVSSLLAVWSR